MTKKPVKKTVTYQRLQTRVDEWNAKHGLVYRDKGFLLIGNDAEVHWLEQIVDQGGTGIHKSPHCDGSLLGCWNAMNHIATPDPVKPPKLLDGYTSNFQTLLSAAGFDDLALVSAIRKSDRKPVALVCAMQVLEGGDLSPVPLAVMVEGNPYELFDDPTVN